MLALVLVAGGASSQITGRQRYEGEKLALPARTIVHDFTADAADAPPESAFVSKMAGAPRPTPQPSLQMLQK